MPLRGRKNQPGFSAQNVQCKVREFMDLEVDFQNYRRTISKIGCARQSRRTRQYEGMETLCQHMVQNPVPLWDLTVSPDHQKMTLSISSDMCPVPEKSIRVTPHCDNMVRIQYQMWSQDIPSAALPPILTEYMDGSLTLANMRDCIIGLTAQFVDVTFCPGIFDENWVRKVRNGDKPKWIVEEGQFIFTNMLYACTARNVQCTRIMDIGLDHCEKCKLPREKVVKESSASASSHTPFKKESDLENRSRALAKCVKKERSKRDYWRKKYLRMRGKEQLNVSKELQESLTATRLNKLLDNAVTTGHLHAESLTADVLRESINNLLIDPKGRRYSQTLVKWCVQLSTHVHKSGYEEIREVLPWPSWRTLQSYKFSNRTSQPFNESALNDFVHLIEKTKCKGIGGVHWDEVHIKQGVAICPRTNELIGFEDHAFQDEEGATAEEKCDIVEPDEDERLTSENDDGRVATQVLQFFWSSLEGDLVYPVASFPVCRLTSNKMSTMLWAVSNIHYQFILMITFCFSVRQNLYCIIAGHKTTQ